MRRLVQVVVLLGVVGVALGVAVMQIAPLQDVLIGRVAAGRFTGSPERLFGEDALRAVVCGSASPLPDPKRAAACVTVFAGGRFYVVDTGLGAWENFATWRVPGERIGAIFYTHFHSDHISELGEFNLQTWAAGRPAPLSVFGPRGVERVVAGFTEAYALDSQYRTAHHGPVVMNPERGVLDAKPFDLSSGDPLGTVVLEENGLVVRAFAVDHAPVHPAVGYRFDYQGRSVVVSGDTTPSPSLVAASKGADVLFHEAQANFMVAIIEQEARAAGAEQIAHILADIPSYHTSPVDAAREANEAGVKLLVLYHLTPPPTNALIERIFMRGVSAVRPEGVVVSRDGFLVTLPAGSDEVETDYLS